jgi:glutathione synthase/RimK-type ligase-like ATP-grasp enzyme
MILCLGFAADDTFAHTLKALTYEQTLFEALDIAQLTLSGSIQADLSDPINARLELHKRHYRLGDYESIYVRLPDISGAAPSPTLAQRSQLFQSWLSQLLTNVERPVLNKPQAERSNFTKLFHMIHLAAFAGFTVPRSCLTNCECDVEKFVSEIEGPIIYKGVSGLKTWVSVFDLGNDMARLNELAQAPVLFQEQIIGDDVRVHVVGDIAFGERIKAGGVGVDYRTTPGHNRYSPIELPTNILDGCVKLAQLCSTPLMGIDFKLSAENRDWYFLEANAMPCYQGYDRRASGAIGRAIVAWLSTKRQNI